MTLGNVDLGDFVGEVGLGATPPAGAHVGALPFTGRMVSLQFMGLGRLDVARELCPYSEVRPVSYDAETALVQLSFMTWNESPVGPYCASFVGVASELSEAPSPSPARHVLRRASAFRAASVLAACLRAQRILFVPSYVVGDRPNGPSGCGHDSQRFGTTALNMTKTNGRFTVNQRAGVTHLQVLEDYIDEKGEVFSSGYALSTGVSRVSAGSVAARMPVSPSLLPCAPLLAKTAIQSMLRGGIEAGVIVTPAAADPGRLSRIATQFSTRPRLTDLAFDRQLAFAPLVLRRPAPEGTLGRILERLEFVPVVQMSDREMTGAILGPVPRIEDGLL